MKHFRRIRPSATVLAAALSTMALYACGQNGQQPAAQNTTAAPLALPLTTGPETAAIDAPSASALPAAPRPKIVRVASQADEYAYVDQAASMGSALGSAPPDYGFDYDGARPWVWRTSDNAARLVEPIDGGYRYYYYQAGAAQPYLIRDPQYAYGFNDGELVVVYDSRGNVLPPQYMDQQADYAGRYLARARALYNASLRSQRHSVIAANWAARRAQIDEQQAEWAQEQDQYSAWRQYHQQHDAEQQAYWQAEHQRREASAAGFDQWQGGGYQGPPPSPRNYAPVAGVAGAALAGGAIGGYLAGRDHHDDHGAPPAGTGYAPGAGAPGFDRRPGQPNPQPNQGAAVAQARQQQAGQDAARQAQAQQQAQAAGAAGAAREQALSQGRQQQATADAARQADAQRQAGALADARTQQAQADGAHQAQAQAAARAQAQSRVQAQAHQQQAAQAAAAGQADAARAQAAQRQAAQGQAAQQARQAARAEAMQARQQQVAAKAQAAAIVHAAPVAVAPAAAAAAAPHPHPGGPRPEDGRRPPEPPK